MASLATGLLAVLIYRSASRDGNVWVPIRDG